MQASLQEKIERHKNFLELKDVERPLIGFAIGGFESFSRYSKNPETLFSKGLIEAKDVKAERLYEMYKGYLSGLGYDDDRIPSVEPLPSIPWSEAAAGCPVIFTGKNFWSEDLNVSIEQLDYKNLEKRSAWVEKYGEFLDFLANSFGKHYPIGQAIIRGPLDMLAGTIGTGKMVYSFYDEPDLVKEALAVYTDIFIDFLKIQKEKTPKYHGGYVIGQYYLWTPGTCARMQADAMTLMSPKLYDEFAFELDLKIAQTMEYNLFHLHASALFLVDFIIKNKYIQIIQSTKDEGSTRLEDMMEHHKKVQAAGKCLWIKGRFSPDDFKLIEKDLDKTGLALEIVVDSKAEADEISRFLNIK